MGLGETGAMRCQAVAQTHSVSWPLPGQDPGCRLLDLEHSVKHLELAAVIRDQEEHMLQVRGPWKVDKGSDHGQLVLLFRRKPGFSNDVIVKGV